MMGYHGDVSDHYEEEDEDVEFSSEEYEKGCDEILPKIIDLSERLQVFSWGLQNYFTDAYLTSNYSRSLEQINYKDRKARAIKDLEDLREEIKAFQIKFGDYDEDIDNACEKMNEIVQNFNNMCTAVDGIRILEAADQDFKRLEYVDAVLKIKELQNKLAKLAFEGNLKTALDNLKQQSENQLALSLAHLSLDWMKVISWSFKKGVETQTYSLSIQQSDPVLLKKLLRALYLTNQMNADLSGLSDFFINKLLINVIKHNCEIFTEDHLGALVFNIKIDMNDCKEPSIQTIFNNLTAVFEFLESTIESQFEADKKFLEYFGDCNRDAFFTMIVNDCVKCSLPVCETSYQAYKEIALELDTFNKFLIKLNYVEEDESPLERYINRTYLLLYAKKCEKMLSNARELIKYPLPHGTETVGTMADVEDKSVLDVRHQEFCYDVNAPLFFPKCVVSQNIKKIVGLIMDHLEESPSLPEEYGKQLALHIKDIAIMYESLVSEKYKQNLKENALEIALFFNNCNYLAHTLMGPPWKNILPKYLADYMNTILMDQIYDLRIVGMEKMSMYLKFKKDMILETMKTVTPWSHSTFSIFDNRVNLLMRELYKLKDSWRDILPERMYEHCMCSLVTTYCEAMLTQLFQDGHAIPEEMVYMLTLRFQHTITQVQELFPEPIKLKTKVKRWEKFTQVPILLTAHLLEISSLWTINSKVSKTFTCEEVRQVIKMRFPDNKYRLKILTEIQ